jgi:hypothetical protein
MIPTYVIGDSGKSITCLDCGNTSWNPFDVIQCYCGTCREFHDDKEMKTPCEPTPAKDLFPDWS